VVEDEKALGLTVRRALTEDEVVMKVLGTHAMQRSSQELPRLG
jgi:hypothetical protein